MQDQYHALGPLLEKARAELPVGGLIHGEAFSLLEAMSAVEIGNAKMDSGMMAVPKSLDELLAEGVAPVDLDMASVLAVMDKLMALEGTWHNGGALAQTVFSCLYMLKPERLSDEVVLSAFFLSLKEA
eukprot:gene13811-19727_t